MGRRGTDPATLVVSVFILSTYVVAMFVVLNQQAPQEAGAGTSFQFDRKFAGWSLINRLGSSAILSLLMGGYILHWWVSYRKG